MGRMQSPTVSSLPLRRRRGGVVSGDQRLRRMQVQRGNSGRAWINGREVGGADPRFAHLSGTYD
jgi:hypothetical protein